MRRCSLPKLQPVGLWLGVLLIGLTISGPRAHVSAQDSPTLMVNGDLGPVEVSDATPLTLSATGFEDATGPVVFWSFPEPDCSHENGLAWLGGALPGPYVELSIGTYPSGTVSFRAVSYEPVDQISNCVNVTVVPALAPVEMQNPSDPAKLCQQGGYRNWTRIDSSGFKNTGQYVAYAKSEGVLKPAAP